MLSGRCCYRQVGDLYALKVEEARSKNWSILLSPTDAKKFLDGTFPDSRDLNIAILYQQASSAWTWILRTIADDLCVKIG